MVLALAELAVLSTISTSLKVAVEDETQREPALITLLVAASGISLFGIGAAFWGLTAGLLSLIVLNSHKTRKLSYIKNILFGMEN